MERYDGILVCVATGESRLDELRGSVSIEHPIHEHVMAEPKLELI